MNYHDIKVAADYNNNLDIWVDGRQRASKIHVLCNDTVLEIGPGPGTLTVFYSPNVQHVTCVEPSPIMRDFLATNCFLRDCANIQIVASTFEKYQSDKRYDVTIASYSLLMDDLVTVLDKILRLTSRHVYLYTFTGIPAWNQQCIDVLSVLDRQDLITSRMKKDVAREICDYLYRRNIAYHMTKAGDTQFNKVYTTLNEAVDALQKRVHEYIYAPPEILESYVREYYKKMGDCYMYLDATHYVRIDWDM